MKGDSENPFGAHLPNVNVFGRQIFDPMWAERDHSTRGCEILHIIAGKFTLVLEGRERYAAGPGDTLFVPQGMVHRDEFGLHEQLDVLYFAFTWDLARAFARRVDNRVLAAMSAQRRAQLALMFDQLRADAPSSSEADRTLLRVRLLAILVFLLREADQPAQKAGASASSAQALMLRAREYIHTHYAECIALDQIAAALNVSPYHLSHVFSQESDFSLFSYLTQVRMDRAKELLKERRLNVSEVAWSVGYEDPNYFSKVFRKHCGCSPSAYVVSGK